MTFAIITAIGPPKAIEFGPGAVLDTRRCDGPDPREIRQGGWLVVHRMCVGLARVVASPTCRPRTPERVPTAPRVCCDDQSTCQKPALR